MRRKPFILSSGQWLLLLAPFGAVIGVAWLTVGVTTSTLLNQSEFQVWILFQGLQFGLWAGLLPLIASVYLRGVASMKNMRSILSAWTGGGIYAGS